jgi:hypothetical protein
MVEGRHEGKAADEFVRGDPFVLHGVVRNWTIREWNEALVPGSWARLAIVRPRA